MFIYTAWQAFKYGYQFLKIVFSGNRFFWYSGNFKNWALAISVFENRGGVVKCRAGAFLRFEEPQGEGAVLLLLAGPEGCVLSGVPSI